MLHVCVRPRTSRGVEENYLRLERQKVTVRKPPATDYVNNKRNSWSFDVDSVLPNASQSEVFDAIGRPAVTAFLRGADVKVVAHGPVASGKSFTMRGPVDFRQRGLVPRIINELYGRLRRDEGVEASITATYVEVYNERLVDLLAEAGIDGLVDAADAECGTSSPSVGEDATRGTFLRCVRHASVPNEESALEAYFAADDVRRTSAMHPLHAMQESAAPASNRGHGVFTLHLLQRPRAGTGKPRGHFTLSSLSFADLAGGERIQKLIRAHDQQLSGGTTGGAKPSGMTVHANVLSKVLSSSSTTSMPLSDTLSCTAASASVRGESALAGASLTSGSGAGRSLTRRGAPHTNAIADAEAAAALMNESRNINRALSTLDHVVSALQQKFRATASANGKPSNGTGGGAKKAGIPRVHVPYRDSLVTHLLQDALFGGPKPRDAPRSSSHLFFISCIRTEEEHSEETISALRLANSIAR